MNQSCPPNHRCATALGYAAAAGLAVVLFGFVYRIGDAHWRVPWGYQGDALLMHTWIKGVVENGWYLSNPNLGSPIGHEMHDFPLAENASFLQLKLLALFVPSPPLLFNLYIFLGFPLTTLSALFVLRRWGLPYGPCLVASLLYTFLPYHFARVQSGHLFLASYYLVPLLILVVVWVGQECLPFAGGRLRRWLAAVAICLLAAASGVYYAFFACFLLLVAGGFTSLRRQRVQPLAAAVLLVALTGAATAANLLPSFLYRSARGPNELAVVRNPRDAEAYGLRLCQLVLPVTGHRVTWLAELKDQYNRALGTDLNENDMATLGGVGTLGLLVLLGLLLRRGGPRPGLELLNHLSVLNAAALLLGTAGGGGVLFSLLGTGWIRCYDRICIFIAFFALAAVAWLLTQVGRLLGDSRTARLGFAAGLAGVLGLGILDQTHNEFIPAYEGLKRVFAADAAFVRGIEARLPAGAAVFQLPYVRFPENCGLGELRDYDPLRPYLRSQRLRWSYAAMAGRTADLWQRQLVEKPAAAMLEDLALAGFSGLYVDRAGYADRARRLEGDLAALLGSASLVSADDRFAFFDLQPYAARLRGECSAAAWDARCRALWHPVWFTWGKGFSFHEREAEGSWRWCADEGEVTAVNVTDRPCTLTLRLDCRAGRAEPARLRVSSELLSLDCVIDHQPRPIVRSVTVPPGSHRIRFSCDGRRVEAPGDNRHMVFRLYDFPAQSPDREGGVEALTPPSRSGALRGAAPGNAGRPMPAARGGRLALRRRRRRLATPRPTPATAGRRGEATSPSRRPPGRAGPARPTCIPGCPGG
jgi:phosphoglycerol transferase